MARILILPQPLLALALALVLLLAGPVAERIAVAAAALGLAMALPQSRWRCQLLSTSASLLAASLIALVGHLLQDDFGYRLVWLYSGEALPAWLKASALWASEEGTLLLLAASLAIAARSTAPAYGWQSMGLVALAMLFAIGALIWSPFAPAPAEAAMQPGGRGLNAHLASVWMALHPPFVLLAYVFILVPAGTALQALVQGEGMLRQAASKQLRLGWLLLSIGFAFGMAWSYEDATYGQLWHWDPVQTSVFAVWAFATAALHGLRLYTPRGPFPRSVPVAVLLAGAAAFVAMAVTRSQTLASSHRYIGDTAQPLFVIAAAVMLLVTVWGWWLSRRRSRRLLRGEALWLRRLAMVLFSGMAVVALAAVAQAYLAAWLEWPRPPDTKPFFDTVRRWGSDELLHAFARWEVDPYTMNRWLAPPAALCALLAGYAFLGALPRRLARLLTVAAAFGLVLLAELWAPLSRYYEGAGMTSSHTIGAFFWLDLLTGTLLWLIGCAGFSVLRGWRRGRSYLAAVSMLHLGVAVALGAFLAATVLDRYSHRSIRYPHDFGSPQPLADGYRLTLTEQPLVGPIEDGVRSTAYLARTGVTLEVGGEDEPLTQGVTQIRDAADAPLVSLGAMRQLCEILDYRYARAAGSASRHLDPVIHRGLWRDVQVWVPAPPLAPQQPLERGPIPGGMTVVVKTFPLVTWLWLGLAAGLGAASWITWRAWRSQPMAGGRRRAAHRPQHPEIPGG